MFMKASHMVISFKTYLGYAGAEYSLGFGVYGSYSESHIKSAQKQVFQQFLSFMNKH